MCSSSSQGKNLGQTLCRKMEVWPQQDESILEQLRHIESMRQIIALRKMSKRSSLQ